MSIDSFEKTGQIFFNLCQASLVGAVAMYRLEERAFGIHSSICLLILAVPLYVLGVVLTNRASRLRRKEEKKTRRV